MWPASAVPRSSRSLAGGLWPASGFHALRGAPCRWTSEVVVVVVLSLWWSGLLVVVARRGKDPVAFPGRHLPGYSPGPYLLCNFL